MECDQKLNLIDIFSEDDLFIDSRLFNSLEDLRLSVTMDNINENGEGSNLSRTSAKTDESTQVNEQKEIKHLPDATIQPGRPSYLQKSSAWDNAFFTSAGLLEPHELSSMNKEFNTSEDHLMLVRARRPNIQSISNTRTGPRDMIDHDLVFKRKNINEARPKRIKTQQPSKRSECNSLKLKHPKVPWESSSTSSWLSKLWRDMYSVEIEGKKKTGPGRNLMVSHSNTHTASVSSTKTPIRSSTKTRKFEILSSSHKSSPATTIIRSMKSSFSTSSTNRAHNDSTHRLNMPCGPGRNVWPPSHITRRSASVPRKNSQPSGLCMPSPKFGFFNEDISMERTFDGNSNKPQKQGMSDSIDMIKFVDALIKVKRAMNPISIDSVNQDSRMTMRLLTPIKSRKYSSDLQSEDPTDMYIDIARKICAAEHERKRVVKKKIETVKMVTKDDKANNTTPPPPTPQSQTSQDRLDKPTLAMLFNLSPPRDKEITSSPQSRNQENEVNDWSSFPHVRTPLVEKKSVCNSSAALMRSDIVKDKESSNLRSLKGSDKENN